MEDNTLFFSVNGIDFKCTILSKKEKYLSILAEDQEQKIWEKSFAQSDIPSKTNNFCEDVEEVMEHLRCGANQSSLSLEKGDKKLAITVSFEVNKKTK
jgi:hypothetical protein